MKANEKDYQKYSDAIDQIQEGYDSMVELFNELENDIPIIHFDAEVIEKIETAKEKYGNDLIDEKINSVIGEILSMLDLDKD
ncbi:MAG TPA: atypical membrane-integrating protein (Mistic protein) [Candidatus Avamphibacillus sp.]|nr:atypical membrane-integrating protein (Mistic protein) [Candidatus Avamphibacillus sp.]